MFVLKLSSLLSNFSVQFIQGIIYPFVIGQFIPAPDMLRSCIQCFIIFLIIGFQKCVLLRVECLQFGLFDLAVQFCQLELQRCAVCIRLLACEQTVCCKDQSTDK